MKYLETKSKNIISTILISALCFAIIVNSGILDGAGMAALILIWLPAVIGIITIVIYLITNMITKKYAPIATILGNLLNLFIAISSLFNQT